MPNVTRLKPSKVKLLSYQSKEYFPKSIGDHQDDESLCFFWSAVVFSLERSYGCNFCPASYVIIVLIVVSRSLTITETSEACGSFDVVLSSFVSPCMSCHCAL